MCAVRRQALAQPAHDAVEPVDREVPGQEQRSQCGARLATHGGDVAQADARGPPSEASRRDPVAAEVSIFDLDIAAGERQPAAVQLQHGGVVGAAADAHPARIGWEKPAESPDECRLGEILQPPRC
jgi:hypothetical protein